MKQRIGIVFLGILAVIAMIWWVGPRENSTAETWSLTSTKPEGAKALADLFKELGMPITNRITLPKTPEGPVLLLDDYFSETQEENLLAYARNGGTIIQVAGDRLNRNGGFGGDDYVSSPIGIEKSCDWPELADVDLVRIEDSEFYESVGRGDYCFARGRNAWLMREQVGKGKIYTLGNGNAFVNKVIEADDNAILAVRLAEGEGRAHGQVIRYRPIEGFEEVEFSLLELVPNWFWVGALQLGFAGALLVYWRLIRPSRVIRESIMTQLPGSTPVLAFGHYLWSTKRIGAVADMARHDCRTRMATQLGVPESESITLIEVVAHTTQVPKEHVEYVLFGPAPADRSALFDLMLKIAQLDQAIAAGPRSTTP